jgi:hypothetical protein
MKHKLLILSSMVLGSLAAQPVLADTQPNGRTSVDSISSQDRTTERAERALQGRDNAQQMPQDTQGLEQRSEPAQEGAPYTRDAIKAQTPQGVGVGESPKGDTTSPIKRGP